MTHKPTGRVYIGQHKYTTNPLKDGYHGSGKIWKRIYKQHADECEKVVIELCYSKEAANRLEIEYIRQYKTFFGNRCVNVAPGGEGFCSGDEHPRHMKGKQHTDETRRKMSESHSGEKNHFFGKHHTDETKRKISEMQKGENGPMYGKHHTNETRRKLSEAKKGEKNPNFGKHLSDETRRKMSQAHKGEKNHFFGEHLSEEHRRKMSEAKKGERHPNFGKHLSDETRKKISEARKAYWKARKECN